MVTPGGRSAAVAFATSRSSVRVGEESELVEVHRGPLPAREHEVPVQLRGGHHPPHEVVSRGRRSRGHRADSIRAWVVATASEMAGTEPSGGRRSSRSLPKRRTASPPPCCPCRCRGSGSVAWCDDPSLEVDLCGIRLPNPIGLAAGFDKTCRHLGPLGRLGFGFVVGGTITRAPRKGNAKPRIVRSRRSAARS